MKMKKYVLAIYLLYSFILAIGTEVYCAQQLQKSALYSFLKQTMLIELSDKSQDRLDSINDKNTFQEKIYLHEELSNIVLKKLSEAYPNKLISSIIDATFLNKMEIFRGGEHIDKSLLNRINRTHTIFGYYELASMLAQPMINVSLIQERQKAIHNFLSDTTLLDRATHILQKMQAFQGALLHYLTLEHNFVEEELFGKSLYYGKRFNLSALNGNSLALECLTQLKNIGNFISMTWLPLLNIVPGVIDDALYRKQDASGKPIKFPYFNSIQEKTIKFVKKNINAFNLSAREFSAGKFDALKQMGFNWKQIFSICMTNDWTCGDFYTFYDCVAKNEIEVSSNLKYTALLMPIGAAAVLGSYAYTAQSGWNSFTKNYRLIYHLQKRLVKVATYIKAIHKLYDICTAHKLIHVPAYEAFDSYFGANPSISKKMKRLLELLSTSTFKGSPSLFSWTGRILSTHTLLKECKDELLPLLEAAGEIDAYISTALLLQEHKNKNALYNFAEIIENSVYPYIELNEFWNPFVDLESVVTNSICLGSALGIDTVKNVILTGPNTAGKSTFIKGICCNILLAQTLGICAANSMKLTPFKHLNAYLNITDDLASGDSLFMAEVKRAQKLVQDIIHLSEGEFAFTIMDELFSGTSPVEGEKAAYKFTEQLGGYDKSICVLATHFDALSKLGEEKDNFKNYYIEILRHEDGSLERTFRLKKGVNTVCVAEDLLMQAGVLV